MAIINGKHVAQYDQVHEIIVDVLKNRKLSFTREIIVEVIKKKLIEVGIDDNITNDIYFNFLLDGNLDSMVECGIIYNFEHNNLYEPLEYIIYKKHLNTHSNVLYLLNDDGINYKFINIASSMIQNFANNDDYVLTGGVRDNRMLVPDISYEEIKKLYDDCISEGSSKKDSLEHILNFYSIRYFSLVNEGFINTVVISNKSKKKEDTCALKTKRKKEINFY